MKLSPAQRIALEALGLGCSVPEAARRANVDRTTVNRWLNHDANFIAAHNACLVDRIKASHAGMVSLYPAAIETVREEIKKGNGWIALQVLRDAKLTSLIMPTAMTPGDAKKEMKLARQQRQTDLIKQQLLIKKQQQKIDALKEQIERYEERKREEDEEYNEQMTEWVAYWSERKRDLAAEKKEALLDKELGEKREKHEQWVRASPERIDHITAQYLRDKRWCEKRDQQRAEEEQRLAEQRAIEELKREQQMPGPRAQDKQCAQDQRQKANPDVDSPPESRRALPGRETELVGTQLEDDEREQNREPAADDDEDDDAIHQAT